MRRCCSTNSATCSRPTCKTNCCRVTWCSWQTARSRCILRQRYTYAQIEHGMRVPFFGSRTLLRAEERDEADNQYGLLERAGIRHPRQYAGPNDIDRLVIVKAPHAKVSFERAFFLARSRDDYDRQSERLIAEGMVVEAGLQGAVIEEFALGPSVNLNFFYSPVLDELELMGTDTRRQTNLEGLKNLPFLQAQALADEPSARRSRTHRGHLDRVDAGKSVLDGRTLRARHASRRQPRHHRPVRTAMRDCRGTAENFIVYDVSLRIPGSPGTRFTPYSAYRWGRDVSVGERIAMEIDLGPRSRPPGGRADVANRSYPNAAIRCKRLLASSCPQAASAHPAYDEEARSRGPSLDDCSTNRFGRRSARATQGLLGRLQGCRRPKSPDASKAALKPRARRSPSERNGSAGYAKIATFTTSHSTDLPWRAPKAA